MPALRLMRASRRAESFLDVLGDLRETRLTATLGFLAARFPDRILPALGVGDDVQAVHVEETDQSERFDVLLTGRDVPIIVEGKLDSQPRPEQLRRYVSRVRRAFGGRPGIVTVSRSRLPPYEARMLPLGARWRREATWTDVWRACTAIAESKRARTTDAVGAAIAEDLALHLEANDLVEDHTPEVYSRDVSSPETTRLFFTYHMYSCQPKFFEFARRNRYFAPYFTQRAATTLEGLTVVPVGEGISYVARIERAERVAKANLREFLKQERPKQAKALDDLLQKYHRGTKEITVLLLGQPHQMFMTPVSKKQLQAATGRQGQGMMGSKSWTFEDLLAASKKTRLS